MARSVLADLDFSTGAKITGLAQATASGQPVVKEQLDALLEGIAWKDDVAAASTGNIDLSSPGATIDGVTMATNDRFLAKDQSTDSQNGIYVWNGASTPATRASDMSASAEFNAATVTVKAGTVNAGTSWRQTAADPTVGSTAIAFTPFGVVAPPASETVAGLVERATQGEVDTASDDERYVTASKAKAASWRVKQYVADIGDASATSIAVTHNLNTRDIAVTVRRNSGDYDDVICDVKRNSVNQVTLVFASAPGSNALRVIITGAGA